MQNLEIFSTTWILAFCAVILASFVRGLSGFGFALILAPLLLIIMDPVTVIVITLFLGFFSNVFIVIRSVKSIDLRRIFPMSISGLLGIPIGAWIISIIAQSVLKITIGTVIIAFAVSLAFRVSKKIRRERIGGSIAGFLSGIFMTSTSLGGPPVILFMHGQGWPKQVIHPSLAAYFLWIGTFSLIALGVSNQMHTGTLIAAASLLPAVIIGVVIGMRIFYRTNQDLFRKVTLAIVIIAGVLAILSGAGVLPGLS
ncbi:sulfite exporter TauE/SafE family protein [Chloroflexota bacterium]